jgi:hypothetical protein
MDRLLQFAARTLRLKQARHTAMKKLRIVTCGLGFSGGHGAVTRRPPTSLYTMVPRAGGYAYDVGVWDLSIVSRAIFCRAVPNPKRYDSPFATFASLYFNPRSPTGPGFGLRLGWG